MQMHNKTSDTDFFGLSIRLNFMILVESQEVSFTYINTGTKKSIFLSCKPSTI